MSSHPVLDLIGFAALPPDVRWRLCPTVSDTLISLGYALYLGHSPDSLGSDFGRSQTSRTSGGGAARTNHACIPHSPDGRSEMNYAPSSFYRLIMLL